MRALAAVFCASLVVACVGSDGYRNTLALDEDELQNSGIAKDCRLAQARCTRCHDVDRIKTSRFGGESDWMKVVDRMRRRPSSGIAPSETKPIVRCLVFRSGGS